MLIARRSLYAREPGGGLRPPSGPPPSRIARAKPALEAEHTVVGGSVSHHRWTSPTVGRGGAPTANPMDACHARFLRHARSRMRAAGVLTLLLALAATAIAAAARPDDRRERFQELARRYAEAPDPEASAALLGALFATVDEEIVENLAAGGPFASAAFLQDRLEAFSDAW